MKRILVPCDFSDSAREAYKFALDLAAANHGEVMVLKAIDLPVIMASGFDIQPFMYDPMLLTELEEDAKKNFDKLTKAYPAKSVPVSFYTNQGLVSVVIQQFIEDNKPDLVVMGTNGASGSKEFLFGSNTEKIVRLSSVPVFAVRKAPAISAIKNIVFPTNLHLDQHALAEKVKELQNFFNATLHLLWINTPGTFRRDEEINGLLNDYATQYQLKNYTLNIRNDSDEQDGIIHFTHEIKADMIAMATHGRRGLAHLFSGSIAEDVVNHVTCPIWTFSLRKK